MSHSPYVFDATAENFHTLVLENSDKGPVLVNYYEEAMRQLLEIVRRDSAFRDQAGRDGLLAVFSLLGEDDERVQRYRAMLKQAMH